MTSENASKQRKIYVYCLSGKSKICLIQGHGHYSDECKVLGDFGAKYVKGKPPKDCGNNTVPRNKFNRQQEKIPLLILGWMKSWYTWN